MDLLLATETQVSLYHIDSATTWQTIASVTPCSSTDCVSQVQLAPCGEYMLALSESGRHLFQIPLASLSDQLSHRQFPIVGQHSCIALSPGTGRSLAAGSHSGQLTVYDSPDGHCRWQRPSLSSPVTCLAFDISSSNLDAICLAGYQSGDVSVINIATGYRHSPMGLRTEDRSACESLATGPFSPAITAAGYRNGALLLWDTNSGCSRSVLATPLDQNSSGSKLLQQPVRAVRFSPVNASLLCSTSAIPSAGLYDTRAAVEIGRIRLPDEATKGLTFSPDGQTVFVGTRKTGCFAYDLRKMLSPVLHIACEATDESSAASSRNSIRDLLLITQRREFDSPSAMRYSPLSVAKQQPKHAGCNRTNQNEFASPLTDLTNRQSAVAPLTVQMTPSATRDSSGFSDSSAEGRALDRILMAPLQLTQADQTLPQQQQQQQQPSKRVTFAESLATAFSDSNNSSAVKSVNSCLPLVDSACQTVNNENHCDAIDNRLRSLIREETQELRRQLVDLRYLLVHQLDITETNLMDSIRQAVTEAVTAQANLAENNKADEFRFPFRKI